MSISAMQQMPAYLLAPKVTAAARSVVSGRKLDESAREALADACSQLLGEIAALSGDTVTRHHDNATLAHSTDESLVLAELVLAAQIPSTDAQSTTVTSAIETAVRVLEACVDDLHRAEAGDVAGAQHIVELFEGITSAVFGRDRIHDFV